MVCVNTQSQQHGQSFLYSLAVQLAFVVKGQCFPHLQESQLCGHSSIYNIRRMPPPPLQGQGDILITPFA